MDMEFRQMLPVQMSKHFAEFDISDFRISTFSREFGYSARFSASDVVYSLVALLETPLISAELSSCGEPGRLADEGVSEKRWTANFFNAYAALNTYALFSGL